MRVGLRLRDWAVLGGVRCGALAMAVRARLSRRGARRGVLRAVRARESCLGAAAPVIAARLQVSHIGWGVWLFDVNELLCRAAR